MKYLILFVSLILPSLCNAAILTGVNGVEILAVDGQKIESTFFTSKAPEVSPGDHQVVVRYANSFGKSEIMESKPHIFTVNIEGNSEITVENINSQSQAEHAIRKGFTWIVKYNNGQTKKIIASDTLSGEGYLPYRDIEKLIDTYNQEQGISMASSTVTAGQGRAEKLIELYNLASKEERKAFRIWLLEQDLK
ncbi:MAG: hypothetical protein ACJAT7_001638 [Psychromonas sp.]|jgi:uncharacterized protein YccT (UPF0319 family)|uniref:DUF2057 domain-containing protein n=1 Tax=Psychromonas sp. TaxID=1884585 RepID=UPI0039E40982